MITAIATGEPAEPEETPEVTYENFQGHYRQHMGDVARTLADAVDTPLAAARRLLSPRPEEFQ
ncbi:hypothetical protein ACG83_10895 [Frankia sp. R43]|uniref:hypothetical protein n=1 Tax=Frankia sp. R43 TaxID=269536 RepID=UPI0006CA2AEE|nr:hypothetical protein [Frankia sp. R43]KPM55772.1 hypothetical protein ACG83_10895 [Frankia sp. R43]